MISNRYQIEIDEFRNRFRGYEKKRIILYGIGRYTATLLEGVKEFCFVGLMDKEPQNIGRMIFGLPVMDKDSAEQNADMIIINTSETYWSVIYNRIQDIKIPIFYKNGERAIKNKEENFENPFYNLSYNELCNQIKMAEIVSFDFYDTLFIRKVSFPQDVLRLIELELEQKWCYNVTFIEMREQAKKYVRKNYSLDELYLKIECLYNIPHKFLENVKRRELEIEKSQLYPRKEVLLSLKFAQEIGKEIYIISDMYLPEYFYKEVFMKYNITISVGHILLSNVQDKSKLDGTMWEYIVEREWKNNKVLHIGDNQKADIEEAQKYGLKTYLTPSPWKLLTVSSIRNIASHVCSLYSSAIMGCVIKEIFKNPYSLNSKEGKIVIHDNYQMGYCVFGPLILTFLLWLIHESEQDNVNKLIFMSRDGYFLKRDYDLLCQWIGKKSNSCYLGISRQLVMTASIESKKDLIDFACMPYTGSIKELFEDRFGILDVVENPDWSIEKYVEAYQVDIDKYVSEIRKNYKQYVEQKIIEDNCAVVDLGYYGNNQRYLNKLANRKMSGYYFNVNLSNKNINNNYQVMKACFQKENDPVGDNSWVLKKMIIIESFLTAPYGMVKAVDKDGYFICAEGKKNQEYFNEKLEINRGVKKFIWDYIRNFGKFQMELDTEFIDCLYGYCVNGSLEFDKNIKRSFYNDNAMMNRLESMLFY